MTHVPVSFEQADLPVWLAGAAAETLEDVDFGVIGFDAAGMVTVYNSFESREAGLSPQQVLGRHLFNVVAPCMNNFMVAQRFEDAAQSQEPLDAIIDYVLTLRMRPVKVKLRLVATSTMPTRFVLVQRRPV